MKRTLNNYLNDKLIQNTLKCCALFVLCLLAFYTFKTLAIKHFIGKFQKQLPWITITHPKQQNWVKNYHTVGQLSAVRSINLSPKEPGIIKQILFKPGQYVKKDEPLIRMENAHEKAQFELQAAELELQSKLYQQYKILYHQHNISKSQYWQVKATFKKAKAAMEDSKAILEHKLITAPFSGIIGIPEIHVGQYIAPGQQHIALLQKVSLLNLDFRVPERFFKQLQIGRKLRFKTQNEPNKSFHAYIYAIEPSSESNAHTIWVRARVSNNKQNFLPGSFVNISVPISSEQKVSMIPQTAIMTTADGPTIFMATKKLNPQTQKKDWQVNQIPIQIISSNKLQSIVLTPLDKNSWIVDSGTQKIRHLSFAQVKEKHE